MPLAFCLILCRLPCMGRFCQCVASCGFELCCRLQNKRTFWRAGPICGVPAPGQVFFLALDAGGSPRILLAARGPEDHGPSVRVAATLDTTVVCSKLRCSISQQGNPNNHQEPPGDLRLPTDGLAGAIRGPKMAHAAPRVITPLICCSAIVKGLAQNGGVTELRGGGIGDSENGASRLTRKRVDADREFCDSCQGLSGRTRSRSPAVVRKKPAASEDADMVRRRPAAATAAADGEGPSVGIAGVPVQTPAVLERTVLSCSHRPHCLQCNQKDFF